MFRLFSLAAILILIFCAAAAAEVIECDIQEIDTPYNTDFYDIKFTDETTYLAYLYKHYDKIYFGLFTENGFEKIDSYECSANPSSDHYIKILEDLDLIFSDPKNFYYVERDTGRRKILKEVTNVLHSGPDHNPKVYSVDDKYYFVYESYGDYEKWILAIDNNPRRYNKHYLVKIHDTVFSEPELILEGYSDCRGFKGFMENDTLYAIWEIAVMKGVAWAESAGRDRSILFSKYDGQKWSDPVVVSPPEERKEGFGSFSPIGFCKLGNNFYAFWDYIEYGARRHYNEILYKWSHDAETWGPLSVADTNFRFVDAQVSSDQFLHLICNDINFEDSLSYYIFDGKSMHNYGALPFKNSGDVKLILDQNDIPHIFYTAKNESGNRRLYHCMPKIENRE